LQTALLFLALFAIPFLGFMHYLPIFVAGLAVAKYWDILIKIPVKKHTSLPLFIVALSLYGARYLFALEDNDDIALALCTIGSAALIILAVGWPPLSQIMRSRPLTFLGHISYSLYLIHFPILFFCLSRISPKMGLIFSLTLSLIVTLLVSYFCYALIEIPMMRLGKRWASTTMESERKLFAWPYARIQPNVAERDADCS